MECLVKPCDNCHKPMNGGIYRAAHICPHCLHEHAGGKSKKRRAVKQAQQAASSAPPTVTEAVDTASTEEPADNSPEVVLTSKSADEQTLVEIMDELSSECVLNLELTPDLFEDGKFVGTKSNKVKAAMKQGQKHALAKLRKQAQALGANIVTNVEVKNGMKRVSAQKASITVKATGISARAEQPQAAYEV